MPGSDGRERIYKHSCYKRKSVLFNLYFAPVWWYNVLYTSIENFDPNNKKVLYIDVSGLDYSDNYRMSSVTVPESVKVVCVKGNGNSYNFHGFEFLGDTTFNLYNVSITG